MTATAPAPAGYDSFAPFYDAFTAGSDYERWTGHVLGLAHELGLSGTRLLDVACGTGKSFLPFLARGFAVTGCDVEPAMLAAARAKAPDVELVAADMRELPALGSFDLVTCFDDSLNHLPGEDELARALASIAVNLAPAGLLVFDLNTLLAYRTTFAVDRVSVHEGTLFIWRGECTADARPGCAAVAQIDVFAPRGADRFELISTRYPQRHFPPHRVTALLGAAGLECVGVHGVLDDGALLPEADEARELKVLYAARLAKGGDPQ